MNLEAYKRRASHNIAESTLKSRMSALRNFKNFLGEDREPTVEDVEKWVDHMIEKYENGDARSSTMREYFKAVKYYFETMNGNGDELEHISNWIPASDSDPGEFLRHKEWDAVRDTVDGLRDSSIIDIMYYYARRPTEVILLNKEDIDLDEGTITFNVLKKKDPDLVVPLEYRYDGGEYQESKEVYRTTFALTDNGEDAIRRWMPYAPDKKARVRLDGEEMEVTPLYSTSHGRISYDSVWNMIKSAARDAGVERNISPKSLRHSRATHLDWAGNSPEVISRQQLAHSPGSDVISKYIHQRGEGEVRDPMELDSDNE